MSCRYILFDGFYAAKTVRKSQSSGRLKIDISETHDLLPGDLPYITSGNVYAKFHPNRETSWPPLAQGVRGRAHIHSGERCPLHPISPCLFLCAFCRIFAPKLVRVVAVGYC